MFESIEKLSLLDTEELESDDPRQLKALELKRKHELEASHATFNAKPAHEVDNKMVGTLKAILAELDGDPKVQQRGEPGTMTPTPAEVKLGDMLKKDRDGTLHRWTEQVLLHQHPTIITTKHGTYSRIFERIVKAGHGAAQASLLRLLQEDSGHIDEHHKWLTLFNLAQIQNPHPKLREYVTKLSHPGHDDPRYPHQTRQSVSTSLLSMYASRSGKGTLWAKQFHATMKEQAASAPTTAAQLLALAALGNLAQNEDTDLLTQLATKAKQPSVRAKAIFAMRRMKGYGVHSVFVQALVQDAADTVKESALEVMLHYRAPMSATEWSKISVKLMQSNTGSEAFADRLEQQLNQNAVQTTDGGLLQGALLQLKTSSTSTARGLGQALSATPCSTCKSCIVSCGDKCTHCDINGICDESSEDTDELEGCQECVTTCSKTKCFSNDHTDRVALPFSRQLFPIQYRRAGDFKGNKHIGAGATQIDAPFYKRSRFLNWCCRIFR